MASSDGHVSASPGAWLAVLLIVAAFIAGTFALIAHSAVLWIITGVLAVAGIVASLASKMMDQAY